METSRTEGEKRAQIYQEELKVKTRDGHDGAAYHYTSAVIKQ